MCNRPAKDCRTAICHCLRLTSKQASLPGPGLRRHIMEVGESTYLKDTRCCLCSGSTESKGYRRGQGVPGEIASYDLTIVFNIIYIMRMSAFPDSVRSIRRKSTKSNVRFRPEADISGITRPVIRFLRVSLAANRERRSCPHGAALTQRRDISTTQISRT